jgi:hypothetical protein
MTRRTTSAARLAIGFIALADAGRLVDAPVVTFQA